MSKLLRDTRFWAFLLTVAGMAALLGTTGGSLASFTANVTNPGNSFQTAGRFAPYDVSGSTTTGGNVQLSWTADSGLSWVSQFEVYRSTISGGPYTTTLTTTLSTCAPTCTKTFTTTVPNSATYYYVVRGVDSSGNPGSYSNEAAVAVDLTPPYVTAVNPYDGAVNQSISPTIQIYFSKAMNTTTTNLAISLVPCSDNTSSCTTPGTAVSVTPAWSNGNTIATLSPTNLTNGTWYRIRVTTSATDTSGNVLASQSNSVFQTVASGSGSTSPPQVVPPTNPANQATGLSTNTTLLIQYTQTMNQSTTNGAVTLRACTTGPANGTASTCQALGSTVSLTSYQWSGAAYNIQTISHAGLSNSTWYQVAISTTATNLNNQALSPQYTFVFQTGAGADTTPPDTPVVTSPSGTAYTSNGTYTLAGYVTKNSGTSAETDPLIKIYRDTNGNGTYDAGTDSLVSSTQLSGGASSFNITVGLVEGQGNTFFITATDGAGNVSGVATVPTIFRAANGTGPSQVSVTSRSESSVVYVDVKAPFLGDFNGNGTATVAICTGSGCTNYGTANAMTRTPTAGTAGPGEFNYTFGSLAASTTYGVRVIYTDSDGISDTSKCSTSTATTCTQTGTVTTLDSSNQTGLVDSPPNTIVFASRAGQTANISLSGTAKAMQLIVNLPTNSVTLACDTAAPFTFTWDGKDSVGNWVADGQYSYTITAYNSATCGSAATQYAGTPIIISNAASVSMSPPPGAVTLGTGEKVAILATVGNYRNEAIGDGATVTFSAKGSSTDSNYTLSRTSALTGQSYSDCADLSASVSSGSGKACTVLTVNTAILQTIAVTASVASQFQGGTTARTVTGNTTVNDPPVPPETLEATEMQAQPTFQTAGLRAAGSEPATQTASGNALVSIGFRWAPSKSPRVVAYDLFVGTESGRYATPIRVTGTEATVPNLESGRVYFLALRAIDAAGREGRLSNEFVLNVPAVSPLAAPPAVPTTQPATPTPTAPTPAAPSAPSQPADSAVPAENPGGGQAGAPSSGRTGAPAAPAGASGGSVGGSRVGQPAPAAPTVTLPSAPTQTPEPTAPPTPVPTTVTPDTAISRLPDGPRLDLFLRFDGQVRDQRDRLDTQRPDSGLPPPAASGDGVPGMQLRTFGNGQPSDWAIWESAPLAGPLAGPGEVQLYVNGPQGPARLSIEIWADRDGQPNGDRYDRLLASTSDRPVELDLDRDPGSWQELVWRFAGSAHRLNDERIILRIRSEGGPTPGVSVAYDRVSQTSLLSLALGQ